MGFHLSPWAANDYHLNNYHLILLLCFYFSYLICCVSTFLMPSVHISALTFNNNILEKTGLRRSHRCDAWNVSPAAEHQAEGYVCSNLVARLFSNLWCGSSSKTLWKSKFCMSSDCSLPRAYQCIQSTHRLKWWDCLLQKPCWLLSNSLYFIYILVSLDLFLYYRWYHIIREGKQTHWSAVSRITPTALFVDGKDTINLPVFWHNISL